MCSLYAQIVVINEVFKPFGLFWWLRAWWVMWCVTLSIRADTVWLFLIRDNHQSWSGRQQEISVWAIIRQNTCFFYQPAIMKMYTFGYNQDSCYFRSFNIEMKSIHRYSVSQMSGDLAELLAVTNDKSRVTITWNPFPVAVTRSQYQTQSIVKLSSARGKTSLRRKLDHHDWRCLQYFFLASFSPSFQVTIKWAWNAELGSISHEMRPAIELWSSSLQCPDLSGHRKVKSGGRDQGKHFPSHPVREE